MKSTRIEKVCAAVTCFPLLHLASRNGDTELCCLLLGAKAAVEMRDKVLNPRADIDMWATCVQEKNADFRCSFNEQDCLGSERGQRCHDITAVGMQRYGTRS